MQEDTQAMEPRPLDPEVSDYILQLETEVAYNRFLAAQGRQKLAPALREVAALEGLVRLQHERIDSTELTLERVKALNLILNRAIDQARATMKMQEMQLTDAREDCTDSEQRAQRLAHICHRQNNVLSKIRTIIYEGHYVPLDQIRAIDALIDILYRELHTKP